MKNITNATEVSKSELIEPLGSLWAFMKAMPWNSMECQGFIVQAPTEKDQPQRFIPVFETLEGAELFAGDDKHLIVELKVAT